MASTALEKATKHESPWVSTTFRWLERPAPARRAQKLPLLGKQGSILITQLLQELRRALDVGK
jgi:hypothetical protein